MAEPNRLPLSLEGASTWGAGTSGTADPLANPTLYDGVRTRRVCAYMVDFGFIVAICVVLFFLLIFAGVLTFGLLWPLIPAVVGIVPIGVLYHMVMVGGRASATPGMRLFNIEVRHFNGGRADYFQAFVMAVLFYATIPITGFLILAVSLFDARSRTLHDMLSGAVVVRQGRL